MLRAAGRALLAAPCTLRSRGPHLDALLHAQAPDLLHEQEDAIPPPQDGIVDLRQLQARKVLRAAARQPRLCVGVRVGSQLGSRP